MQVFFAGKYTDKGYPVMRGSAYLVVAHFVEEAEAQDYAEYRNTMLEKYNTTDVRAYKPERM